MDLGRQQSVVDEICVIAMDEYGYATKTTMIQLFCDRLNPRVGGVPNLVVFHDPGIEIAWSLRTQVDARKRHASFFLFAI